MGVGWQEENVGVFFYYFYVQIFVLQFDLALYFVPVNIYFYLVVEIFSPFQIHGLFFWLLFCTHAYTYTHLYIHKHTYTLNLLSPFHGVSCMHMASGLASCETVSPRSDKEASPMYGLLTIWLPLQDLSKYSTNTYATWFQKFIYLFI